MTAVVALLGAAGCSTVWGFEQGQPASGSGAASVGGNGGEGVGGNGLGGNGLGGSCGIETLVFGERSGTGIVSGVTSDAFVREDLPTDAYGAEGNLWLFDDDAAARVGLLRFDLSSLPPQALIQSADSMIVYLQAHRSRRGATAGTPYCGESFARRVWRATRTARDSWQQ